MMKLGVGLLLLCGSLAYAQDRHGFDCDVESPFGKSAMHAELGSAFLVELTDKNRRMILASMSQICGQPMDFQKNCTLVDDSQPNFISYSVNCFEDNDPNGRWLAKFDLAFYESNGVGVSHCSGAALPMNSYKLNKCVKY